jgi:hypothetical protein
VRKTGPELRLSFLSPQLAECRNGTENEWIKEPSTMLERPLHHHEAELDLFITKLEQGE